MGYLTHYNYNARQVPPRRSRRGLLVLCVIVLMALGLGYVAYSYFAPKTPKEAAAQLQFGDGFSEDEIKTIRDSVQSQSKTYRGTVQANVTMSTEPEQDAPMLMAYVPVTNVYAPRQAITTAELKDAAVYVPADTDDKIRAAIASSLGLNDSEVTIFSGDLEDVPAAEVAFMPVNQLSPKVKLLTFEDSYYLDSLEKGALFRQVKFSGSDAAVFTDLTLSNLPGKETVLSVNMTGVTALTRVMMRKLNEVKDPLYFSEKIGEFLAAADLTHVSNEVSFQEGCQYSSVSFCSPPEFIETLKHSGVDLVELTGNHNNDRGNKSNTESIELYHSLGMATFGGGLNRTEAAMPYMAEEKGSRLAFIGYNMADGPNSGAIAGETTAGANYYTDAKAKADIEAAKQDGRFVIVSIQYSECQAYPNGYVEFPLCDGTIGGQEEAFRQMIDFGADMVVGSSAHQPQTYELYKAKPIYYGLGNLYFDQTQWPGTERGIVLTHYFVSGELVQTKLSPTVYDRDLQTRLMNNDEAVYLLKRLNDAR